MEIPPLRNEYRMREPNIQFPIETHGVRFELDANYPAYLINAPINPDFAFEHSTSYKRCGNVIGTFIKHDIKAIGTLYVSDEGAWMVVNKMGCIQASGSTGAFPIFNIDIQDPKPYRSKSRFDDIIICGD